MTSWEAVLPNSRRSPSRWIAWLTLVAFLCLLGNQLAFAQDVPSTPNPAQAQQSPLEVALTFDDLPSHGPLPPGLSRVDIINSIIAALQAAHAPQVYGFINAKRLEDEPGSGQVLQLWRDAGFPLGNHTYSHMDLDTNTVEAFEKDILVNEATLQKYAAGQDWHWFRFPYLREGDTAEKHHAIEAFLKERGYKVAEVTLSFSDYVYNEPYARCVAKHDAPAIEQLKQGYLDGAAESLAQGRKISDLLYHRDTKYIMLLHVGGFQTVMLPKLLDLLKQKNFQLITLPEAAADSIYNEDPALTAHWDNLFSQQVMQAHHLSLPDQSANALVKLNDFCR
jgi:peptidoglycan-N-acetylglucosamine deacetylase